MAYLGDWAPGPMSATREPVYLPPGVTSETYTYRNGTTTTVYRAPYPTEGPIRVRWPNGQHVLLFLYAAFTFEWSVGKGFVRIGLGTCTHHSFFWTQAIHAPWGEENLAAFGQNWARSHMAKFR